MCDNWRRLKWKMSPFSLVVCILLIPSFEIACNSWFQPGDCKYVSVVLIAQPLTCSPQYSTRVLTSHIEFHLFSWRPLADSYEWKGTNWGILTAVGCCVSGSASCVKADEGMLVSERCCPTHCVEDQEDTCQHGHYGGHQDLRLHWPVDSMEDIKFSDL